MLWGGQGVDNRNPFFETICLHGELLGESGVW